MADPKMAYQWKREPMLDRAVACAILLHVQGYMTDGESQRIRRRIARGALRGEFNEPVPIQPNTFVYRGEDERVVTGEKSRRNRG